MAHTKEAIASWRGRNAVDSDGKKIGKIEQIYLDAETGRPEWLAVTTGLFGSNVSFVPIAETSKASADGGEVRVPYYKQQVKDAPNAEPDGELSRKKRLTSIATMASTIRSITPIRGYRRANRTPASVAAVPITRPLVATPAGRLPMTR